MRGETFMPAVPEEARLNTAPDVSVSDGTVEEPTVADAGRARGRPEQPDLRLVDEEMERREDEPRQGRPEIGFFSAKEKEIRADGQWVDVAGPNQDSVAVDETHGLLAVADGVGGEEQGDKASKAACGALRKTMTSASEAPFILSTQEGSEFSDRLETLLAFVEDDLGISPARFAREEDLKNAVQAGFTQANQEVAKNAPKGATTLSAGVIFETPDGKQRFLFANRGDSRIYRYRAGALEQLTQDDSLVFLLKEKGLINNPDDESEQLSAAARNYLRTVDKSIKAHYEVMQTVGELRNVIMSALRKGEKVDDIAIFTADVQEGDIIVAATDGVCDNLTREQLLGSMQRKYRDGAAQIAREIVAESRAVAHSASPRAKEDDMSAVVAKIRAGVSLDDIFEKHADAFYNKLQTADDPKYLDDLLLYLYAARNQAEMAMAQHPENRALIMLRDHILERLHVLDERVTELKRAADIGDDITVAKAG